MINKKKNENTILKNEETNLQKALKSFTVP